MNDDCPTAPGGAGAILVVGGYGHVGVGVCERLARAFPHCVIVAGRNPRRAADTARTIGHGAIGRAFDLDHAETVELDEVRAVVVCVDQTSTAFVERCLARGIHYVDITASESFIAAVERLDCLARRNNATAILSVGVSPGLTNLLAAHIADHFGEPVDVEILLELGLGDSHGGAAVDWVLDSLDATYTIRRNGQPVAVRAFDESRRFEIPGKRPRRGYRFGLPDQLALARKADVHGACTWIRFSSGLFTWMVAAATRCGLGSALRRPLLRRAARWAVGRLRFGSDRCTVAVFVTPVGDASQRRVVTVEGRGEARMTAVVAAETVRQLLTRATGFGVFHSDAVVDLGPVLHALDRDVESLEIQGLPQP